MYTIKLSGNFKQAYKRCKKRGLDMHILEDTVEILRQTGTLPPEYRPHKLVGRWSGYWEAHLQPDWLLVWEQHDQELLLVMIDTGTHSDLF